MQIFTIRDIENLTGIKAHTLRIWEQRYKLFIPKRKESQHRIYDNEDLKALLRISFLYHNGFKISKLAKLSHEEIIRHVKETQIAEGSFSLYVTQLIESALDFNEYAFINIVNEIIEKIGFEKCIVEVCYRYLQKVGLLWSTNNIIPAQEHFTSCIIQNRIIVETEKISAAHNLQPSIVLFCPHNEFHELPLLFINYLLRKNSWGTIYLGANSKIKDVEQIASLQGINYLYMHLITNFTGYDADEYFEKICKAFASKKVLASGEGIKKVQRTFSNLTLLKSDQQIYDFIERKITI